MKRLLLGLLLIGWSLHALAFSRVPELPERMGTWWLGVTMPSFYPVAIDEAYGVNESQDWSSPLHRFSHTLRKSDLKRIQYYNPDYDGFQLPLGTAVSNSYQVGLGTKQLPEYVVLKWTSLTNARFFTTKFDITQDVAKKMMANIPYEGRACYQTQIVFGLLPDGRSKVWLDGCGKYTYITELQPYSENTQDINGFDVVDYQDSVLSMRDSAKQYGVSELFPIPWERLNTVYYPSYDKKSR